MNKNSKRKNYRKECYKFLDKNGPSGRDEKRFRMKLSTGKFQDNWG